MLKKITHPFLSLFLLLIVPIAGFFLALFSLKAKSRNRILYFIISLFYFFFMLRYPPFSDSYFKYLQYESISDFNSVLTAGNDIFFFFSIYIAKLLGIPFFIIPAFYSFLMVYFSLNAFGHLLEKESVLPGIGVNIFTHVVLLSYLNVLNWGAGIRYGMAMVWFVSGVIYYIYDNKRKGSVFILLSIFMHFSMLFFLFVFALNKIYKVRKRIRIVPVCFLFFISSSFILPWILSNITFLGISEHATIYLNGLYSRQNSNFNALVVAYINYSLFLVLFVFFLMDKRHNFQIDNFIAVCCFSIFLASLSVTGFGRFMALCEFFLLFRILIIYVNRDEVRSITSHCFLFVFFIINFIFFDIYLQRDQIIMAKMWQGVYKSPISLIYYNESKYRLFLSEINYDGTWVKHEREAY